jgi:hypothetical protein
LDREVRVKKGWSLGIFLAGITTACGSPDASTVDASAFVRSELSNGGTSVMYSSRPSPPRWTLQPVLRIGAGEEPVEAVFGDVRGIDEDLDGSILVLDAQADELRRFAPSGDFLETLAREGEGPGELMGPNGLQVAEDGTIWMNDHGNWRVTALRPDGSVSGLDLPSRSYSYIWSGFVTENEWVWDTSIVTGGPRDRSPGVKTSEFSLFFKGVGPDGTLSDSVFLGTHSSLMINTLQGGTGVPGQARVMTAVDPSGFLWSGKTDRYRFVCQSLRGDTVLIIELPPVMVPLPGDERAAMVDRIEDFMDRTGRVSIDYDELLPTHQPVFHQLSVDDLGRLWVGRITAVGETIFDVFSPDGELIAEASPAFAMVRHYPPRIKNGAFYTLEADDFDIPLVIKAEIVSR